MVLPQLYTDITPLNREQHQKLKAPAGVARFGFAGGTHLLACVIDEFGVGSLEMPILFAPANDTATAVFLVGCEAGKSVFVKPDGSWAGRYVPAYIRRMPFIVGDIDDKQSVICADINQLSAADGEPLFNDKGENTPFFNATIDFVNQYAASGRATEAFAKKLMELKLLSPVTIDFQNVHGKAVAIHGLMAVDEGRLASLTDEQFLELRRAGYLPLIYAHRNSLNLIPTFTSRMGVEKQAA
ncbi:SapC family protein [Terrarubrum flagellatum]|uniref:SapC family protein n=1 Tax=Terrirubrum flagellatum TaxID=2895980 RepID=UPI003145633B